MKKLFVVGDSISMQYGPFLKSYISGRFDYSRKGEEADWGDINNCSAVNGGDSACVLSYLESLCGTAFHADILLLNCGLHDIKTVNGCRQVDDNDYRANLERIVKTAGKLAGRAIWVRSTHVDDETHNRLSPGFSRFDADIERYNRIADAVMRDAGLSTIDLNGFTRKLDIGRA